MKIFIDTTAKSFVLALFDAESKLVDKTIIDNIKEKSEILPIEFSSILKRNNLDIKDIKKIFINIGPGTFTGVRISLVFARTLAQLTNIELFYTNTFLLFDQKQRKEIYIDARGKDSYFAVVENNKLVSNIELVEKKGLDQEPDYLYLINNFSYFENLVFEKSENILEL
ncbi:tRNA (adenosine(37)-N6)-threonylcarbamoyltransferase complex dimerization subunit type 1 TsaB, partial [Mycoplasma procyoni]|uniref:tRNA (adenosine(37)-N6)-threonylcarbamoyltransferase complex dimerization subunit type 1 TsaB n=1 Tax=Mycoplasma procyoni TaxID=568784 RepID=UPI00197BE407